MSDAPRLNRRLLVLRVAAIGASAAVVSAGSAQAQGSKFQPRGTGVTDSDPNDGPGNGRGFRGTGITDSDPNDGAGNGRGRPRGTGLTDSDPNDGAGNGRGGNYRPRSVTDSDPNDGAGRGRGYR